MRGVDRLKRILFKLLYLFRVPNCARFWNRKNVMILCYHGITARPDPDLEDSNGYAVHRDLFVAQLRYLKRHYNVIALRDFLVARQTGQRLPHYSVILTFDDGARNFLTVAASILIELELPATIFLITDRVNARNGQCMGAIWTSLDDKASLSWSESMDLKSRRFFDFGSHTCSHANLLRLSSDEVLRQLEDSLLAVTTNLGAPDLPSFAYPYGQYSDSIAEQVRLSRYSCAFTTRDGSNPADADLFRLGRAGVRAFDRTEEFAAKVSGLRYWMQVMRNLLLIMMQTVTRIRNTQVSR
jgi:peptidoglycan/xylan/chitin deacetylase (PgdA/CDA1 family)